MELLPSDVESKTFRVVRRGYDPEDVHAYLKRVGSQMSSLEERAKIASVKADRMERKLFEAQRAADPVAGVYDDVMEIRRRLIAEAEEEARRVREAGVAATQSPADPDGTLAEVAAAGRAEATRIEAEAQALLQQARAMVQRAEGDRDDILREAQERADRIVAAAVARADAQRLGAAPDRPAADGSALVEPTPPAEAARVTVDLTGAEPAVTFAAAAEAPAPDAKPSRYMSRSAGLPRLGEGAGSVLGDMAKVREKKEAD